MDKIKGIGKNINIRLSMEELDLCERIKDATGGDWYTDIFRCGLRTYQERYIDELTQNNEA